MKKTFLNSSGTGAYQVLTLTNDSSYGFVAKVKATKDSKIRLVSEKGGTIAEVTATGDYQDIKPHMITENKRVHLKIKYILSITVNCR